MHRDKKPEWRNATHSIRTGQFVEMVVKEEVVEPQVYRLQLNDVVLDVPEDFDDEVVLRLLYLARAC